MSGEIRDHVVAKDSAAEAAVVRLPADAAGSAADAGRDAAVFGASGHHGSAAAEPRQRRPHRAETGNLRRVDGPGKR